jgi:hypothetical protein
VRVLLKNSPPETDIAQARRRSASIVKFQKSMRTLFSAIFGIALAARLCSEVLAAEDKLDCNDIQSPIEERECGSQEWTKLDKELNEIWKKALASTPQAEKENDRRRERPQLIEFIRKLCGPTSESCGTR